METMQEIEPQGPPKIPSLWPETEDLMEDIDPFDTPVPGTTIRQKLRYLFSRGLIRKDSKTWWAPNDNLKLKTLKYLYAAMIGFKKENLPLLYPSGEMGDNLDEIWLTKAQQTRESPSVRDRCCGHVFEKGETYYRCKQCCADPTVVICSSCFNTQDHSGHFVTMLVGNGSGGCCDCGDPEAFNPGAPRCGIHVISTPDREVPPLPDEIRDAIKETMEAALDFVIDVYSTMPMKKDEVDESYCIDMAIESQLRYPDVEGNDKESDGGAWVAVLYNDEVHSYNDVTGQLARIDRQRYTKEVATEIAHVIDNIGRAAIVKEDDVHEVVIKAQGVMLIGLFCSVRTERDFLRECVASHVLHWLMDCISIGVSVGGDEMILREILCQSLAGKWEKGINEADWRVELDSADCENDDEKFSDPGWDVTSPSEGPPEERWIEGDYIRLDWILFFDSRLWKSLRKCIKSIILGCLLGGKAEVAGAAVDLWGPRNWKRITGIRFARDFAQLCRLWLKYDREPHLSVTKLGVQIFTTPSISLELVERYQFLTHLLAIEFTYFTRTGSIGRPWDVEREAEFTGARDLNDDEVWKPDTRIMDIQEDIHHLLGNEAVRNMIPKNRAWLRQFLDFFSLFQGMHLQIRETGQHREYESNAWEVAHSIVTPISRLMGYIADGFASATRDELRWAYSETLITTYTRCKGDPLAIRPFSDPVRPVTYHRVFDIELVDYKVAEDYVSLYYPLNWMLALLVSKIVDLDRDGPTNWRSWNYWDPDFEEDPDRVILTCVDYPLRANVFCSQIRAKLWTRNGLVMLRQYYAYNLANSHSRASSDFTFLQWGFAILPDETMLLAMLDRYDLINQLTEPSSDYRHRIYGTDALKIMIEEFFHMFLNLMNERSAVLGDSSQSDIKREIAHRLIFKKLPYSDILRQVRNFTEIDFDDDFDKNLKEMAHFHPPTNLSSGTYELKSEYYSLVDPHHRSYTRNQAVECEKTLLKIMAQQDIPEANRVIEPSARVITRIQGPFAGLTKVLGTPLFVRVVYCGIRFAVASPSETILDMAIYLCLIAVMYPDTQFSFVHNAQQPLSHNTTSPSLVHSLLAILNQDRFSSLAPKVRHLLSKMNALDPRFLETIPQVQALLSGMDNTAAAAAAAAEEKKRLAKKRQMDALNRMKLAQSRFQEQHKALFEESETERDDFEDLDKMGIDEEEPPILYQFPHGACILCQEEVGQGKAYGIPAFIHQNTLVRCTPLYRKECVEEVGVTPTSLDIKIPRPFGQANKHATRSVVDSEGNVKEVTEKVMGHGFPKPVHLEQRGLSVTSCGHLLHYRCWQSYFKSVRARGLNVPRNCPESSAAGEFLCPLCRALCNILIPIPWSESELHAVGSPLWNFLKLENLHDLLETVKFILTSKKEEYSWGGMMKRINRAYDEIFPSLVKEQRNEVGIPTGGREYNMANDGGYIQMYNNFAKHVAYHVRPRGDLFQLDSEFDTPAVMLAGAISSVEMATRGTGEGVGAELAPPTIGAISQHDMTLLRILGKSVRTIMVFQDPKQIEERWRTTWVKHFHRMIQLFPLVGQDITLETNLPSVLEGNIFEKLVISCSVSAPCIAMSTANMLLIHYFAEAVKCIIGVVVSRNTKNYMLTNPRWLAEASDIPFGPRPLLKYIFAKFEQEPSEKMISGVYRMVQRFILPFLRKSLIFLHVYEGLLFPDIEMTDEPESDRICRLLGLPTLAELMDFDVRATNMHMLIHNWTVWWRRIHPQYDGIELFHPSVFELIGLPQRLDVLLEYASKYHCPNCKKLPDEPSMCLFCGDIVCTASACCEGRHGGEMNEHRRSCTRTIGVFLWLKRNSIVYLREPPTESAVPQGELRDAPYLNVHGETERDLRNGQPQYLSQERYDRIRTAVLKHQVETTIARRIESSYDSGGWETL